MTAQPQPLSRRPYDVSSNQGAKSSSNPPLMEARSAPPLPSRSNAGPYGVAPPVPPFAQGPPVRPTGWSERPVIVPQTTTYHTQPPPQTSPSRRAGNQPPLPARPPAYTTGTPYRRPTGGPSTSSSTAFLAPDESITDAIKDTSKGFIKGLGHNAGQILKPQEEPTEQEQRVARDQEKEYERKEEEYVRQQKLRILGGEPHAYAAAEVKPLPVPTTKGDHIFFNLTGNLKKTHSGNEFSVYVIHVTWNGTSWTVYRRFKQFVEFNSRAKKASFTFSHSLPPKQIRGNLKDEFVAQRQKELQKYMEAVSQVAPSMLSNKPARLALLRFFAPIQIGDKQNPDTVLPFDLTELVG